MIYIITSLPRCGSSMMMRCLEAGGLPVACDESQEYLNVFFGDDGYQPNGNGFYALTTDFRNESFVALCDGKAVKVPHTELIHLPQHEYKIIFMLRDPNEILASMHRFMPEAWPEEAAVALYDLVVPALIAAMGERGDTEIQSVQYADIVADPMSNFQGIGWPIDATAAASMVEPSLYRFKLEEI